MANFDAPRNAAFFQGPSQMGVLRNGQSLPHGIHDFVRVNDSTGRGTRVTIHAYGDGDEENGLGGGIQIDEVETYGMPRAGRRRVRTVVAGQLNPLPAGDTVPTPCGIFEGN